MKRNTDEKGNKGHTRIGMERWLRQGDLFIFCKVTSSWVALNVWNDVQLQRCTDPMFPPLATSFPLHFALKWRNGPGTLGINYLFDFNLSVKVYRYYIGFELPFWGKTHICLHATGFYKCKSTIRSYLHENTSFHLFLQVLKSIVISLLNEINVIW